MQYSADYGGASARQDPGARSSARSPPARKSSRRTPPLEELHQPVGPQYRGLRDALVDAELGDAERDAILAARPRAEDRRFRQGRGHRNRPGDPQARRSLSGAEAPSATCSP